MNNQKNNISANLRQLRSASRLSQEEVAEKIGVSRQAVAKWETGDTLPDLVNCGALADLYGVQLDDLVRYNPEKEGIPIGPRDKHIFGTATIGERGQIVLPKKARDTLGFKPGDTLMVLGDTSAIAPGIALMGSEVFLRVFGAPIEAFFKGEAEKKEEEDEGT